MRPIRPRTLMRPITGVERALTGNGTNKTHRTDETYGGVRRRSSLHRISTFVLLVSCVPFVPGRSCVPSRTRIESNDSRAASQSASHSREAPTMPACVNGSPNPFVQRASGLSGHWAPASIQLRSTATSRSGRMWRSAIAMSGRSPRTMWIRGLSALLPVTMKAGFPFVPK